MFFPNRKKIIQINNIKWLKFNELYSLIYEFDLKIKFFIIIKEWKLN